MWDVIIVGAGAAGMTAGIYTCRRALSTCIISRDLGGQAALTDWIENYPGVLGQVHGFDLMENFRKQYEGFGGTLRFEEVKRIKKENDHFLVESSNGTETAQAVILAFGLTPRELNVPGEDRLKGKGVTYCANCDGPLYKGKIVGVVGAAGAALDAAEYLSRLCQKVYLFPQREKLLGSAVLNKVVQSIQNIEILYNKRIIEIAGDQMVDGARWEDVETHAKGTTLLVGVFIEIGYMARTDWVKELVALDTKGQVIVDKQNRTNVPGIFAAGDVTDVDYKQVVISAGEGAKAALEAYKFLQTKLGKPAVLTPDWGSNR
ncbi:MAG: FAD-dependent oxidoreductase [Patescibacteria group bacterium]